MEKAKEHIAVELFSAFRPELVFALDICEQAAAIAMRHYKDGVSATAKYDGTPVTIADTECERLIRTAIESKYPGDSILGEEEGATEGQQSSEGSAKHSTGAAVKRRWLVDPIDGTYGFARGNPVWSTLLALEENDEIVLGVVNAPALKETFWAEKGKGAWKNGARLKVSNYDQLDQAQFDFGGLNRIIRKGFWPGFSKLVEQTARQRSPGDYVGFAHVLEGKSEAQLEVDLKPWDLAPFRILIKEAGGAYSDLAGGDSIYTGSCLITNGILHEQFLKTLTSP